MTEARLYAPFIALTLALHLLLFSSRWSTELTPPRLPVQEGRSAIAIRLTYSEPSSGSPAPSAKPPEPEVPRPEEGAPSPPVEAPPLEPATQVVQASTREPARESAAAVAMSEVQEGSPTLASSPATSRSADPVSEERMAATAAPARVATMDPQGAYLEAHPISSRKPEYPSRSVLRGEEGRVLVHLEVGPDGRATDVSLEESSGHYRLDRSVLRFVRKERFVPATRGEVPVASSQVFSFRFVLEDAGH